MGYKPLILQQSIISEQVIKKNKIIINMKTHNPLKQIKERRFLVSIPSFFSQFSWADPVGMVGSLQLTRKKT
jgi:hypothetical protein